MRIPSATPSIRFWMPGEQVLLRFRRLGPVSFDNPVTVVHDGSNHTALWRPDPNWPIPARPPSWNGD